MINHMGALATFKPWPYGSPGLMYTSCTPHVHTCKAATCFPQMFILNNIRLHRSPGHMGALATFILQYTSSPRYSVLI